MRKQDMAEYLVSLNTLMKEQFAGPSAIPSAVLTAEYHKYWSLLKQQIVEDFSETGKSPVEHDGVDKDGTNLKGDQPRRS